MEGLLGARQHVTAQIAIADHADEGPMRHDRQVADVRSNHQIGGVLGRARAIHCYGLGGHHIFGVHIDLQHGFILLDKTKSGEHREIPINAVLRQTRRGIMQRVDSPYVCTDAHGKRFQDVKQGLQAAYRQAGIVCARREPGPEANYTKTRQYKKKGVNSSELTPLIS
jgi:hypothetical protein